ncbi:polysaccharide biosynthesis C-terminal domain-containing protein [Halorutilales archaeon Cl-col2-1]
MASYNYCYATQQFNCYFYFPHVSKWDSKDSYKKIENILPEAMTPALLLSIPAFFGTVVLSKEILGLVFGEEYTIAWIALIILMGEKLLQSVHIILGRSLQAINRPDLAAKSGIIAIVINFVLNIFFIWEFGLVGAAVATAVSFIVNSILHAHYLSQFIKIRFETKKILWSLASALIMTGVLIPIKLIYGVNNIIQLGMVISLGVIVYTIVLFLSSRIRTDAINMAQNL